MSEGKVNSCLVVIMIVVLLWILAFMGVMKAVKSFWNTYVMLNKETSEIDEVGIGKEVEAHGVGRASRNRG